MARQQLDDRPTDSDRRAPFVPSEHPFPVEHSDTLTGYEWPYIGLGISLAGGAYPLVCVAIGLTIAFVMTLGRLLSGYPLGLDLHDVISGMVLMGLYSGICAIAGMVWAALVSLITLPIIYLFAYSLRLRGSIVRLGGFCGGLVGFISVLPILLLSARFDPRNGFGPMLLLLGFGPALTTVLGQLGGVWGGRRAAERRNEKIEWKRVLRATGEWISPAEQEKAETIDRSNGTVPPRLQFRIHHLLWLAVWISVLMTAIRLMGIPFEVILPLVGGWLIYQALTLYFGTLLFVRLGVWWTARRAFHVEQPTN